MVGVDPRLGTEIAGYRIEGLLRRDGTGVVYLAQDVRLNRPVTLRLLNPKLAAGERFLRESQLAASIEHPNILPVYEAGEADGHVYIASGYVEGADLASLLAREGRLEPGRALLIVTQLAAALDTARWSRGLVHGSLQPEEVVVVPAADAASPEQVLLRAFGLRHDLPPGATVADASRHFATVDYLAPEQIEARPVSPRTDIYALGCLLFQCLTGRPPFTVDSSDALLQAHLHEPPPSATRYRADLPAAIDRVIARAMAKWPEERYSTCAELAGCAQAALAPGGQQPERAPVDGRLPPVAFPARPQRTVSQRLPPAATERGSVVAPASQAQKLRKSRRTLIAAISPVALLAALVAGAVWLTGRDAQDVSSMTPAPPDAATPDEVAVEAGETTAEPPAEAGAPAAPETDPTVASLEGLAPEGAKPSLPKRGESVLNFSFGHTFGDPGHFFGSVYADGRLIWQRLGDAGTTGEYAKGYSTGSLFEQRLTPEGVELVRAEVISTGLFDHDLHLQSLSGQGLYFGRIEIRTGDRLVHVTWGDSGPSDVAREMPTPEQVSALIRLDARLADPASWLPATAWENPEIKAYVPSAYQVCYHGAPGLGLSRVLALLPPAAVDMLRTQDRTQEEYGTLNGSGSPYWCSDLTNEEAHALARIFDDADLNGSADAFGLAYGEREPGATEFSLWFTPLLPHETATAALIPGT